jgi:hypothetical protein
LEEVLEESGFSKIGDFWESSLKLQIFMALKCFPLLEARDILFSTAVAAIITSPDLKPEERVYSSILIKVPTLYSTAKFIWIHFSKKMSMIEYLCDSLTAQFQPDTRIFMS